MENWRSFRNISRDELVDEIVEICVNLDKYSRGAVYDFWREALVKEHMLLEYGVDSVILNVDTDAYIHIGSYSIHAVEIYGEEGRDYLNKLNSEIWQKTAALNKVQYTLEMKKRCDKYFEKCVELGLMKVNPSKLKAIALEFGEVLKRGDTATMCSYCNLKLAEHWGIRERSKRTKFSKSIRVEILRRDDNKCQECGSTSQLEIHHIMPVSRGGSDEMSNLITLCRQCNNAIGDRIYTPPDNWVGNDIY
jgi:5-methylcytosine-specific restriction endonuclease McrA